MHLFIMVYFVIMKFVILLHYIVDFELIKINITNDYIKGLFVNKKNNYNPG